MTKNNRISLRRRVRSLRAKYWLFKNFLKRLRRTRDYHLEGAFGIQRVAQYVLAEADISGVLKLTKGRHYELLSLMASMVSCHQSIMTLAGTGSALEALGLLRSLLIRVLTISYLIEDEALINTRLQNYLDWTLVRLSINTKRTMKSSLARLVVTEQYAERINNDAIALKQKLGSAAYERLERSPDFLSAEQRREMARKLKMEDHYEHVFAEGSAVIHAADIYDRLNDKTGATIITLTHDDGSFWPLMFGNFICAVGLMSIAKAIGQKDYVKLQLSRLVFNSRSDDWK